MISALKSRVGGSSRGIPAGLDWTGHRISLSSFESHPRRVRVREGIAGIRPCFEKRHPVPPLLKHRAHIQALPPRRVRLQILCGEAEQGRRGRQPVLLKMNKRAGELDQPFVEAVVRPAASLQPKILQHVMRLVEKPLVETFEVSQVSGVQVLSLEGCRDGGDLGGFMSHTRDPVGGNGDR